MRDMVKPALAPTEIAAGLMIELLAAFNYAV
jgi:hypothetical protein